MNVRSACFTHTAADHVPGPVYTDAPSSPVPLVKPSGNHRRALGKTPGGMFQTWAFTDRLEFVQ